MTIQSVISYGDQNLHYSLVRQDRREDKIAIHVEPDGAIIVEAPWDASQSDIHIAVHKRARWVFQHVEQALVRHRHVRPKSYISGEEVLYLGRRYVLKVLVSSDNHKPAKLRGNRVEVPSETGDADQVKAKLWAWYRMKGRDYFERRLKAYRQALPWLSQTPAFQLKVMEKRWGSCTAAGSLIINPHLIKAPRDCIDYVLLHELAHLKHHDHGPKFWNLISSVDPDWRSKKERLDHMAELILHR